MNTISYSGNLAANPELRVTSKGDEFTRVRMGHHVSSKETHWVTLVGWGDTAKKMVANLRKGMKVHVEGKLLISTYESGGQQRTEVQIRVRDFDRDGDAPTLEAPTFVEQEDNDEPLPF